MAKKQLPITKDYGLIGLVAFAIVLVILVFLWP